MIDRAIPLQFHMNPGELSNAQSLVIPSSQSLLASPDSNTASRMITPVSIS